MWWLLITLLWWCGTSAVPAPDGWRCPEIQIQPIVECSCDMPHTLRCIGDKSALKFIGRTLRTLNTVAISLLDCTVQNVTHLTPLLLEGVALHGLVISSGEIKEVHRAAFQGLATPLQALGLPNNLLTSIPTQALKVLPELDRLDLSGNRIASLEASSFLGLRNLSFIELSENLLKAISPNTFANLPNLKTLRLQTNRIAMATISKLNPLPTLEELDLSTNDLKGPLRPDTFPKMVSLRNLQISHNTLSSIKKEALKGLTNLTSLTLHHNQIDVLEDHAFSSLSNLVYLDLSHNRIVAVSGASLAHLESLMELDLRHNFLRALTADLIQPLRSLKTLRLDDNDISIVASDALKPHTVLSRLTLSENPLNCDCSLSEFAIWLANSSLPKEDRDSAVCTTPPSLENGLLFEIPISSLPCGEEEQEEIIAPMAEPIKARITLNNFDFDGEGIRLEWNVEDKTIPFNCDAIFVYEEEGENEVLLESSPLKCNSSDMSGPNTLAVSVPPSMQLELKHRYRYCIVLMESGQQHDDSSLIVGCSDIIPLIQNIKIKEQNDFPKTPKVIAVKANLTDYGSLSIEANIYPSSDRCQLNVAILDQGALLSQRQLNCSQPNYVFVGLTGGPYKVCANVLHLAQQQKPRCIAVFRSQSRGFTGLDVAFISIFLLLSFSVIGLIWGVRKVLLRPKMQTHQCFAPPEGEQQQHNRYVKLQATTKL